MFAPSAELRELREAFGAETFELVLDGLTDADVRRIVGIVDKHHTELKTASRAVLRAHLAALATNAEPSPKPVKVKRAAASTAEKQKISKVASVNSPAFSAIWDGKDYDAPAGRGKRTTRK